MNNKIRYAKQLRNHSCGATVIINAIKWAGGKISHRAEQGQLCDILGIEDDCGTTIPEIKELIQLSDFPFKIKKTIVNPKIDHLKKHIVNNGAIIFFYCGHVSLITEYANKKFTLINHLQTVTVSKLSDKQLTKWMVGEVKAFLIEKKI